MSIITPTAEELANQSLSEETLFIAVRNLNRDGFLVLEGVEDPQIIDGIREALIPERAEIEQGTHKAENETKTNNFLQGPPAHRTDLGVHRLYSNPFVLQVLNVYLGPRPQLIYASGNNAGKHGTERQRVHTDCTVEHPEAPYMVAAQWVMSDFSSANGATEIWPGSHILTTADDHERNPGMKMWIRDSLVEERAKYRPPIQVQCKQGGVFLRDMRLWHAGMPNKSDEDRIMLAYGYTARWYACEGTLKLPKSVEHLYPSTDQVEVRAEYLPLDEYRKVRNNIADNQFLTRLHVLGGMGRRV